jgi:hypothetical protein
MKRTLSFLVAMAAVTLAGTFSAGTALAAPAVTDAALPKAFREQPPYMQNQICGELLLGMTRMSIALYNQSGVKGARDAAAMVGTRAMTFLKANASLSEDEQKRARDIASQIEMSSTPANPGAGPYEFCETRAQRWLKDGVVSAAEVKQHEAEVRTALDRLAPLKAAQ